MSRCGVRSLGSGVLIQPLVAAILVVALSGCAAWPKTWSTKPCCLDTKPRVRKQSIAWHLADVTVFAQIEQAFHLLRVGRKWFGMPVRALNLSEGTVAHSAFFTPRNLRDLSPEAVRRGSSRWEDPVPPFVVTSVKAEGKTAGFFVEDEQGVQWLLKLDPVDAPGLLSGAEVVTSRLLDALGYHVPFYTIVELRPRDLRVGPGATRRSPGGVKEPLTSADLDTLLGTWMRDGRVRAVASRILEGEVLGPARFRRFRDCADVRALKVVYAWLNNIDTKDHNTLLVWNGERTMGYHIDFGTSLGADAGRGGPKDPCAGWTNIVDPKVFVLEMLTLGFYDSGCDRTEASFSPSVGRFSSRFDLDRWKPYAPNLAFEEMTDADAQWIARRMAHLSRAHLTAAVAAGQYRAEDAAYLVDVLEARRQAVVDHYLNGEALTE